MKTVKIVIVLLIVSLGYTYGTTLDKRDRKARKKAKIEKVKSLLDSKMFTFTPQSLTTSKGYTHNLTSTYELTLRNDSAFAYLPFWGRSYTAIMGTEESGIKFTDLAKDIKFEQKKNLLMIKFESSGKVDKYEVTMKVSPEGYTSVSVNSNNKSRISFYGQIDEIEKK